MKENKVCCILWSIASALEFFSACIGFVTDNTGLIAACVPLGSCFLCLAAMYYNKYKKEK